MTFTFFRFFRAVSYRQFTHLVHGFLGSTKRIALPACTYNAIRSHFKPENEECEFRGFEDDDVENDDEDDD